MKTVLKSCIAVANVAAANLMSARSQICKGAKTSFLHSSNYLVSVKTLESTGSASYDRQPLPRVHFLLQRLPGLRSGLHLSNDVIRNLTQNMQAQLQTCGGLHCCINTEALNIGGVTLNCILKVATATLKCAQHVVFVQYSMQ